MKIRYLNQHQNLVQAPAGVGSILLPMIEKHPVFSPALILFEPLGRPNVRTHGQKVGKFLALRLELG